MARAGRVPACRPTGALSPVPAHVHGFDHTAVVHHDPAELVAAAVPFVLAGLHDGGSVLVNLPGPQLDLLRGALGAAAGRVVWRDTTRWEAHPARRLRALGDSVAEQVAAGTGRLHFVGACPLPDADAAMVPEWLAFDAALNEAFAGAPLHMLCLYDGRRLPPSVLDEATASHPTVGVDPRVPNPDFEGGEAYLRRRRPVDLPVPVSAARTGGQVAPADARRFAARCLAELGATEQLADDLQMALSELVTNAWQAGATSVGVSIWGTDPGVAAQVDDDGPGLWDAMAGYRRPDVHDDSGRGLWITRQLADVVRIRPTARGTSVRVQFLGGTVREGRPAPTVDA